MIYHISQSNNKSRQIAMTREILSGLRSLLLYLSPAKASLDTVKEISFENHLDINSRSVNISKSQTSEFSNNFFLKLNYFPTEFCFEL